MQGFKGSQSGCCFLSVKLGLWAVITHHIFRQNTPGGHLHKFTYHEHIITGCKCPMFVSSFHVDVWKIIRPIRESANFPWLWQNWYQWWLWWSSGWVDEVHNYIMAWSSTFLHFHSALESECAKKGGKSGLLSMGLGGRGGIKRLIGLSIDYLLLCFDCISKKNKLGNPKARLETHPPTHFMVQLELYRSELKA